MAPKKAATESEQPKQAANNLGNMKRLKVQDVDTAIVIGAIKALKSSRANPENGLALVTIRKHIVKEHNVRDGKAFQAKVKEVIGAAFRNGFITMTNGDGSNLHFGKRFDITDKK